jgi:molybdopterin synthase catalytic subunit
MMSQAPFALEWTIRSVVFGKDRTTKAHDWYETEEEMAESRERLKQQAGIQKVVSYHRVDGQMQVMEVWPQEEEGT